MAENIQNMYHHYFGKNLIKCNSFNKRDNVFETYDSGDVLKGDSLIVGVYFSFVNVCDEFTKSLVNLYERINERCDGINKFEVVQVVLWTNTFVNKDAEQDFNNMVIDLPWFAIPFSEFDKKSRLSRRYNIKPGMATLVLVEGPECKLVTPLGRDRAKEDPEGLRFPWRPRPVSQVLRDVRLLRGGFWDIAHDDIPPAPDNDKGVLYSSLDDNVIRGFYFSAHWCPPCRAFTPQLVNTYQQIRKRGFKFEIIFVSSDRSMESFETYTETMPWLAVGWSSEEARRELAELLGVQGIPALVLLDVHGDIITNDARDHVTDDPDALNFPWKPRSVNILTERYATRINDYPAVVLFIEGEDTEIQFAESILMPIAENYYKKHGVSANLAELDDHNNCEDNEHCLQFLIGVDSDTSDILREFVGLDDVVPLLTVLDIPERKYAFLEYGVEINLDSATKFIDKFLNGSLDMHDMRLHDKLPECDT